MLREIFNWEGEHNEPLSYADFKKIGMSEKDYLEYLAICERLKSVAILFEYMEFVIINKNKSILFNEGYQVQNIGNIVFEKLLDLLQKFCHDDLDLKRIMENNYISNSVLILYMGMSVEYKIYGFINKPVKVYIKSDEFRIIIENVIKCIVYNEDVIDIFLEKYTKTNADPNIRKPTFPANSRKIEEICDWVKAEEHYFLSNSINKDEKDKKIEERPELEFDTKKHTLYIYSGRLSCYGKKHKHKSLTAKVKLPEALGKIAYLDIVYCADCDKYYINETSYELYRDKYGFLPIYMSYIGDNHGYSNFYNRADKSPLFLCGYNVSQKDGMSDKDRQEVLKWIIDNKISGLGKAEILNHLNVLIKTNGRNPKMKKALEKWKADLEFVNSYLMDEQEETYIDRIYKK